MGKRIPKRLGAETNLSRMYKWNIFPPTAINQETRKQIVKQAGSELSEESEHWDRIERAIQEWHDYREGLILDAANPTEDREKLNCALEAVDEAAKSVKNLPRYILYDRRNLSIQTEFTRHCEEMHERLVRGERALLEVKDGARTDPIPRRFLELIAATWPLISKAPLNLSDKGGRFIAFVVALSNAVEPSPALTEKKCKNLLPEIIGSKSQPPKRSKNAP